MTSNYARYAVAYFCRYPIRSRIYIDKIIGDFIYMYWINTLYLQNSRLTKFTKRHFHLRWLYIAKLRGLKISLFRQFEYAPAKKGC